MRRTSFADFDCSIAGTLELIGEWWTPLVLREVFFGRHRFEEIQEDLGIARNILAARLRRLVDEGILYRYNYGRAGTRYEYRLTDRGLDLYRVLLAFMQWGDRWLAGSEGPPTRVVHATCGHDADPELICGHCGGRVDPSSLELRPGPGREEGDSHPLVRAERRRHEQDGSSSGAVAASKGRPSP